MRAGRPVAWCRRSQHCCLVAVVASVAALLLPAGTAVAQSPVDGTIDVKVLGTDIHLELRLGPRQPPVEPPRPGDPPPAPVTPAPRGTFDDQMAEVTRRVPAFGGVFVNERRKTLYVYMQGGLDRAAASTAGTPPIERALRLLARSFHVGMPRVRVLRARYDFRQLDRWHDRMRTLFRIPGVVGTGVDERRNRLEVEVSNPKARRAVLRRLTRLGIPRAAAKFSRGRVGIPQRTLQDRVRPMVGGQQISRGPYLCSVGIFGYSYRQRRWGFITNAHCTHYMAQNDGTRQYQNTRFGGNFGGPPGSDVNDAGTEVEDPGWGSCTFWFSDYPCRYSDSAFHALPSWMDPDRRSAPYNTWQSWDHWWSHGTIALPSGGMNYDGWSTGSNGFPVGARWIKAVNRYPVEGTGLDKVGRTTGWTRGTVEDTCDNKVMASGPGRPRHIIACAWEANYYSASGDSGAPVFYGVPPNGEVVLAGLNFGSEGFGGNDALFTPIGQIEKDLGTLYLCRLGYPGSTGPC